MSCLQVFASAAAVLAIALIAPTHGFSAGAPPLKAVCRDMVPQHHDYKAQTTASPYIITTNTDKVDGGSVVKIRINSTDGTTKVRGFYIQARDAETNLPIGTFSTSPQVSSHSCNSKRWSAATHTNSNQKDFIDIEWTAPTNYEGEVLILGTVLRDFVTFWSGNYAEPVSISKKSSPPLLWQPLPTVRSPQSQPAAAAGGSLGASVNTYFRQLLNIFGEFVRNVTSFGTRTGN